MLAAPEFDCSPRGFISAGDSVLRRLRYHIEVGAQRSGEVGQWSLYEQLDKATGQQYNAKDLTWSYAEVLTALAAREEAVRLVRLLEAKPLIL